MSGSSDPVSPGPQRDEPNASASSSREAGSPESQFASVLRERGLHAALGFLNARTRHRFTGLYRVAPPTLFSICMYDRENPGVKVGDDSPLEQTYCSIVAETVARFALDDSRSDANLSHHPARDRVISYCGVPVVDASGVTRGTLCHFDLRPRIAPILEIPLMERVSSLLLDSIPAKPLSR